MSEARPDGTRTTWRKSSGEPHETFKRFPWAIPLALPFHPASPDGTLGKSRPIYHQTDERIEAHISAWATRQRLVLGQESVAEKSNEITAIPLLLRRLELTGALVTIDAMGTQREIAQTIIDGGADYVLALKENWPPTYAEVERVFTDLPPDLGVQFPGLTAVGMIESETERGNVIEKDLAMKR
jgi:hypothetical protein